MGWLKARVATVGIQVFVRACLRRGLVKGLEGFLGWESVDVFR